MSSNSNRHANANRDRLHGNGSSLHNTSHECFTYPNPEECSPLAPGPVIYDMLRHMFDCATGVRLCGYHHHFHDAEPDMSFLPEQNSEKDKENEKQG